MPDYASILRRSISALPDSSPELREAVYQRARAALARQLTAVEPPLSTREIQAQHQELEDAVARLEADYATPLEPAGRELESPSAPDYFRPPPPGPAPLRPAPARPAEVEAYEDPSRRYDGDQDDEEDEYEENERASRTPLLVGLIILVLVVGGAAAYAYAERDRLFALFDFSGTEESVAAVEPQAPDPAASAADAAALAEASKRPDRLTNGSDAPQPAPPPSPPPVQAAPSVPADVPAPVAPLPAEAPAGLDIGQPATAPEQSIVEQRAIYYFQGAEGTPGQATPGNVTWAQTTKDGAPAVQATLRLDGQEVATIVTIYKNNDPSLPASHLVEVQFSGQLGPTPVQRVPALVIKQTEQARGQPLTGAAVPVTNELFWIALSDDQEQVTRNLQLLREGSWFDIPILFNDGTRALLTFEKGIPGDKVFETAMAAWNPG